MVKIVISYCSPSFHFLIPLFLFLLIFFPSFFLSSSFHSDFSSPFHLFVYCNFFKKKKTTFEDFV